MKAVTAQRQVSEAEKLLLAKKGEKITADVPTIMLRASLEEGISYAAGYPGSPTAAVMDVLSDTEKLLEEYGIYFESSTNEASAATKLILSVYDKIGGFVNWKVVGTNVAADVLAHITSSGTKGKCVIMVGEDYETDSTTVEMKSQMYAKGWGMPIIDPTGSATDVYRLVKHSFRLSEACSMPVIFLLRTMAGNSIGSIVCEDEIKRAEVNVLEKRDHFTPSLDRYPLPPISRTHMVEKYGDRIPRALEYIKKNKLNKFTKGIKSSEVGFITHGGTYNSLITALEELGQADITGNSNFDILNLAVLSPLVPDEITVFCREKKAVFVIEEGEPNFIEEEVTGIVHKAGLSCEVYGKNDPTSPRKGFVPMTGGLSTEVLLEPLASILALPEFGAKERAETRLNEIKKMKHDAFGIASGLVVGRNPTFCTGCPERPVFTVMKYLDDQYGRSIYAGDIGCYVMAKLPPFEAQDSCTGMGTSIDVSMAFTKFHKQRVVAAMGDGTFYHRGLTNIDNFLHNMSSDPDSNIILIILENYWTAMTGHHQNPASKGDQVTKEYGENLRHEKSYRPSIEKILKTHGVKWLKRWNAFELRKNLKTLKAAYDSKEPLKVIISDGECTLARQRREGPLMTKAIKDGKRIQKPIFQIDENVCSGCFPCEKYNGCPSVTMIDNPNPLRTGYIKAVEKETCTACGCCGVTNIFGLCPSTYTIMTTYNPHIWEKIFFSFKMGIIGLLR